MKVTDAEMITLWILNSVNKRKKVEILDHQILKEVIKEEDGYNMAASFEEKYKELKIEGKREKTIEAQYVGSESLSRQRFQRSQSSGRS